MRDLIDILHSRGCSCVISNGKGLWFGSRRGVMDLLDLLHNAPEQLAGACVADKVVGKGAAALMSLGGVTKVYADVMSQAALNLLNDSNISASFGSLVPNIINRSGNGICPVESLCADCATAAECLPKIENFIKQISICKPQ